MPGNGDMRGSSTAEPRQYCHRVWQPAAAVVGSEAGREQNENDMNARSTRRNQAEMRNINKHHRQQTVLAYTSKKEAKENISEK